MNPARKSRSSSRRSSILKPPKPRHPLQNLNFNSSSNENSPTTTAKIKRRVSFAEKKHVKEFCNSVEQGTVWDSTYEEHDLSNLKPPCHSNQEECEIEDACTEQASDGTRGNEVHFVCNKVIEKDVSVKDRIVYDDTSIVKNVDYGEEMIQEDEPISPVELPLIVNRVSKSIIVYEDEDDILHAKVSRHSDAKAINFNYNKLDATSVEDACMEITEAICNNICADQNNMENNEAEEMLKDVSMEFTQAVLPSLKVQTLQNDVFDQDKTMDLSAVPSIQEPSDINNVETFPCFIEDRTKKLDMSMEMTGVVSHTSCNFQRNIEKSECNDNRDIIFHDASMETTKAVRTNVQRSPDRLAQLQETPQNRYGYDMVNQGEKSKLLDMSMEMTKPVPVNVHSATKIQGEKSKLLDMSMEMTKAVPVNVYSATKIRGEKSKLLDTSMEMTTAVPVNVYSATKIQGEKSQILDISMEMTKPVPVNVYSATKIRGEKSKLLDTSMEMTTPVPINVHSVTKIQGEKSQVLDTSMEMTAAVPINAYSATKIQDRGAGNCSITEKRHKILRYNTDIYLAPENINKTRTFSDEDMECTGVVAIPPEVYEDNLEQSVQDMSYTKPITPGSVLDNCSSEKADGATIFHNNSMMMTKVISTLRTNEHNRESGRTMVFQNTSVEITEAITAPRSHSEIDLVDGNEKDRQSILPENLSKNSLTQTEITPEPIVTEINSALSESKTPPDKENCTINNTSENIDNPATEKSVPIETQNSVNTKTSMALHETLQLDTCASALKESNMDAACGTINSMNIEYHKNDCLQNTVSYSRRTYTIQPLNNNRNLSTNDDEDNNASPVENDTSHMFFANNLEELESIKPPSFLCLDDSSEADISMNVTGNQEIVREINYLQEESNCRDRNLAQTDEEKLLEEDIRRAQTFLLKRASVNNDPDISQFEQENQRHLNKIEKLNLLEARHINTDLQGVECSSSIISDTEECSVSEEKNDSPNLSLETSNLRNQSIEGSLRNIRDADEGTGKTESSNKVIDTDMMVENDESYGNQNLETNLEMNTSSVEESSSVELDRFTTLITELKIRSKSDHIIWEVYHENSEKQLFIIGFMSCSLLLVIYLQDPCEVTGEQCLKEIRMISRLADDADSLIWMVHRLILEKLDTEMLLNSYNNHENIFPMLDHASKEAKLAMDFMFEVKRLYNIHLMDISRDSISFIVRSKRNDIILKITMDIKPFDKIESQNISVDCLLGSVREEDIKKLIINIKRDHKFLRRYINDIKDYLYLVESGFI